MENGTTDGVHGDRPQWLGSLARLGKAQAEAGDRPAFEEGADSRWLGSVARRQAEGLESSPPEAPATDAARPDAATEAELEAAAAAWRGNSVRSAVFATPRRQVEPAPAAQPEVRQPAQGRIVRGELGMTLRVAA